MSEFIFIQNVSKKTYIKAFLVASSPIFIIFIISLIEGKKPSFLYFFLALFVLNGILFGAFKIAFPRRVALKTEGTCFYVFYKNQWVQFNPSKELVLKNCHVRIRLKNRYMAVHFEDDEYRRFLNVLEQSRK